MDPKDFAMGEAEHLDYAYRLPLYSTMELFIETLTGTCFELRVSPYETVISVKAKIQRLEGIPITQQFLIWQNVELEDDYCLHDYNITDGCTLKLVLAMRGGPINTRRIAMEEPGLCEMADYVESNREELFDKLSPPPSGGNSNKQVTLLVYRDGDQLNFFRVVDRGDGTLTPFSESLSGSACNLREVEEDEDDASSGTQVRRSPGQQPLSVAQLVENNITAAKMKQLRSNMQNLNIQTSLSSKTRKQSPSSLQATPVVKLDNNFLQSAAVKIKNKADLGKPPSNIQESSKHKDLLVKRKQPDSDKLTDIKSENKVRSDIDAAAQTLKPLTENKDVTKPGKPASAKQTPISRADFRRSQLKRMKSVNTSAEISQEIKSPTVLDDINMCENKHETTSINSEKNIPALEKKLVAEKSDESANGRFSPRTRRLLNALENNSTQRRSANITNTSAHRSPRSTNTLQGMTFNRHDMYLRSYGLIPSPDEGIEERVVSTSSEKSVTPTKLESSDASTKVYETSQGVKYSSLGGSRSHYWGTGGRLLKSPPMWGAAKDTSHPTTTWHPTPKSSMGQLLGETLKGGEERVLKPPSSSGKNLQGHQKPVYDDMVAVRAAKKLNLPFAGNSSDMSSTKQRPKLDALPFPQPPASSATSVSSSWQKQRLRRLNLAKPQSEASTILENHGSEDPLLSSRRPFRQTSSKSGLRMKESPHGKVESMSRQEAREVVDFINKAVDASILRTFVRSPVKDSQRGNSGQTSHRLPGAGVRHGDTNRSLLRSSHGGHRGGNRQASVASPAYVGGPARGPQILPPVKPPSKKKRCFLCTKRTGLATSYVCRCGNNFCATHRYAETHNCTYDYKTTGRKLLEEANPLVSAPKLPKI